MELENLLQSMGLVDAFTVSATPIEILPVCNPDCTDGCSCGCYHSCSPGTT
jgi:hypothetical protein